LQVKDRPFSFKSGVALHDRLSQFPDPRIMWFAKQVIPESGTPLSPVVLYWQEPLAAIQSLLDRPSLADHLEFVPRRVWDDDKKESRVFNEIFTGNWAWRTQVRRTIETPKPC